MLQVRDIETCFFTRRGAVRAVNGVSFDIAQGEIVGVVGESGCGKSAMIRSILKLIQLPGKILNGSALFKREDLLRVRSRRLRQIRGHHIGFVAQNPFGSLNPILSIGRQFKNLIEAHSGAHSASTIRTMAIDSLNNVGIAGAQRVFEGYAHELSGGMAQRVVIAMATVLGPDLLIADEPTTALDMTIQRQILDLLQHLATAERRSMLIATHDLGVVAQYCDRVIVMYAGKVVETGPTREVFRNPAHPYTFALLNSVPQREKDIPLLTGRVPSLIDYPKGCPFANRCRFAVELCHSDVPTLKSLAGSGEARSVSCHYPLDATAVNEVHLAHRAG